MREQLSRPLFSGGFLFSILPRCSTRCTDGGECLVVLHEENDTAMTKVLVDSFRLTLREAEVLYWVIHGKTNYVIGDIFGISHRTINKHVENLFEKLDASIVR